MLRRDIALVAITAAVALSVVAHMCFSEESTNPVLIALVQSARFIETRRKEPVMTMMMMMPPRTALPPQQPNEIIITPSEKSEGKQHNQVAAATGGGGGPPSQAVRRKHEALVEACRPEGLAKDANMTDYAALMRARFAEAAKKGNAAKNTRKCRGDRLFAVSPRKDFNGFVAQELVELGLCRARDVYSTGVDFYLGEQFDSDNAPPDDWARHFSPFFNEGSVVGSMPGLMRMFGSKDAYAMIWWRCKDLRKKIDRQDATTTTKAPLCSKLWLPSFNVNGEERKFKEAFRKRKISAEDVPNFDQLFEILSRSKKKLPSYWIVKPQRNTYESRGMHLTKLAARDVASKQALLRWVERSVMDKTCSTNYEKFRCDRRKMSFQYYVDEPLLIKGHKFDVRLWLVITSIDPLRVFVTRHAYPKIASRAFDLDDLGDQCRHIRMLMDPHCDTNPDEFLATFENSAYPKTTASPVFFRAVNDSWVDAEAWWHETVWPAVESAFTKIFMLVRPSLLKLEKAAESRELEEYGTERHRAHRRFGLLSPDLAIDKHGRPFVEEINTNGMIMGTHLRDGGLNDLFTDDGYLRHLFMLLGANGHPDQVRYNASLEAAIDAFCDARHEPCSDAHKGHLRLSVHEEAHAGPHWYRLYPPIPCFGASCAATTEEEEEEDGGASWWPQQARVTGEMRRAMQETPLDVLLREFQQNTDTSKIHGVPQVPGHGRWAPRTYAGLSASP
ncbi:hypothetical protein CTAYLR_004237 [Chrysophaeum taylorii]|uniref:Uncharacterized protein n=1 Tax=Chrysophaeum taylorii TaxID=2483200 RepID=A0AAD7XI38_9STRA|nr:hypothetical protein CTAYLR_004237 [Chrysophaeum taylorii]